MSHLRALTALNALLCSLTSWAAPGLVEAQLSSVSTKGMAIVDPRAIERSVSSVFYTTTARSPGLWHNQLVVGASVTQASNDYSQYYVTSEAGQVSPLSRQFKGQETAAEGTLEFKRSGQSAVVSYGQSVNETPFPFKAYSLGYNYALYSGSLVLGGEYNHADQKMPTNYFDDPADGYLSKARPTSMALYRTTLWAQQILSDRWKAQIRYMQGRREDRPMHYGFEIRQSYALTDRLFGRLDFGMLDENRATHLSDERGYFQVGWLESQMTYELLYDLLITASLGTTVEREDKPWDKDANGHSLKTQVGVDTYGLRIAYSQKRWTAGARVQWSNSNTNYRATTVSGSVSCEL